MCYLFQSIIALFVAFALAAQSLAAASANESDASGSPRLASLAHELQAGNRQALTTFWREMEGKAPIDSSPGHL
jgi:hypothetical protein